MGSGKGEFNMLTIIIPCYNVSMTLARTLDSLLNQTNSNWKAIMVDDGSTDYNQTARIAQEYVAKYPDSFHYIYQKNLGVGGARNTGLQNAEGEYVCFLDSDDWLMPEFVDTILRYVAKAEKKPDIIITLPVVFDEIMEVTKPWMDEDIFWKLFPNDGDMVVPQEQQDIFQLEVNACRKIYRTDFLRKIRFQFAEHTKWEDILPHFELLSKASSCMGIGSVGFYYRVGSSGQTTAGGGTDRLQTFPIFQKMLKQLEQEDMKYLEFPVVRCIVRFSVWCVRMADTNVRRKYVEEAHLMFKHMPSQYIRSLYRETWRHYKKADAIQYMLFVTGMRYRVLNWMFYDYYLEDRVEGIVKKLLHSKGKVA